MTDADPLPARRAATWAALAPLVDRLGATDAAVPLRVVDVGGGTGHLAVQLAESGHHVTVLDPSPDALASLARRAGERGVGDSVVAVQADAGEIGDHVAPASVDLVLCHGTLEVLDDPRGDLVRMREALRPGGGLSLQVPGRSAAVLSRALAGDVVRALAMLRADPDVWDRATDGPRRYTREQVVALVGGVGFDVVAVDAVRVLGDLVPRAVVDADHAARSALDALERAAAAHDELAPISAQTHVAALRTD